MAATPDLGRKLSTEIRRLKAAIAERDAIIVELRRDLAGTSAALKRATQLPAYGPNACWVCGAALKWNQLINFAAIQGPGLYSYRGFKITTNLDSCDPRAKVFDPAFKRLPPLYETTSVDEAMKWIDARIEAGAPATS